MFRKVFIICLIALLAGTAKAQVNLKDSVVFAPLFQGHFAVQLPVGTLADRFGANGNVGGSLLFKDRHNFLYGMEGTFLFGNNVKEDDMLDPIRTAQGDIIDRNGEFAEILLLQRGFSFQAKFGKLFPVIGPNQNSGIVVLGGLGFLEHKIRFENRNGPTVPILEDEYLPGYDRLSNGAAFSQFLGYYYLGNKRVINFFFGVEFTQAITRNRRSINYDTQTTDTQSRFDQLMGIRAGWMLPLYKRLPKEFYYQ